MINIRSECEKGGMVITIELNDGDRIYKIIEARTFGNNMKRFISKIDRKNKITVLTYTFNTDDIKKDQTIGNKQMMLLIKEIDEDKFQSVIDINYQMYPGFAILSEKNYSDKSLEDAIELMNLECSFVTDTPIKTIIEKTRRN
jgi:hypothetical protein